MKQILTPVAIAACEGVENSQCLLEKKPLQIGLNESSVASFAEGSWIILDYGKEMNGGVRILTDWAEDVQVRIRFGESITECCAELGGEKNATNDHAHRDITTSLMFYSDVSFANTGYRFIRLDVLKGDGLRIKSILGTNHILSAKHQWKYEGDDQEVAAIYETAKRTVDLCSAGDYVWDGVKRDRLVWIGDMHPEMLAITAMYGQLGKFERSLDFVRDQTPLPAWMNRMPAYSMWWTIIVADYFEKTGKESFARRQISYMKNLLVQMNDCVGEDGELKYPGLFVDWPTRGLPDEEPGVRAINIIACQKAIAFLEHFGEDADLARQMLEKLLKRKIQVESQKQVLGLKHWAVGLDEEDKAKLLAGGAKGMSTFMSYYILKAVASFDKAAAVAMMKEYYGAMLQKGATTFWEDFEMEWMENTNTLTTFPTEGQKDIHGDFGRFCYQGFRHSFCHGWSAGVIAFIKEEL